MNNNNNQNDENKKGSCLEDLGVFFIILIIISLFG